MFLPAGSVAMAGPPVGHWKDRKMDPGMLLGTVNDLRSVSAVKSARSDRLEP
jgi:hypothetical protein